MININNNYINKNRSEFENSAFNKSKMKKTTIINSDKLTFN